MSERIADSNGDPYNSSNSDTQTNMVSSSIANNEISVKPDDLSMSELDVRSVSSKPSTESLFFGRQSMEFSQVSGRHDQKLFDFHNGRHSGSKDFSPLGNNSIYEIVMNTRRKNWLNAPTSYDIPPVSLTKNQINSNWRKEVYDYVKNIKPEYGTFESMNNIKSINRRENLKKLEDYEVEKNLHSEDRLAADEARSQKWKEDKTMLEIPELFFEDHFQLGNPRTFQEIVKGLDTDLFNMDLMKKNQKEVSFTVINQNLSANLENVEDLLVSEISRSSHKFFIALAEVDEIEHKIKTTVSELKALDQRLQEFDVARINRKIHYFQSLLRRKNVEKFEQGLLQVQLITQKVDECKDQYFKNNYNFCLDLINSIDILIHGGILQDKNVSNWTEKWPYKLLDLKAVPALASTREYLTNMKIEIGGHFSLQLCDILLDDLTIFCTSIPRSVTLERLQKGKPDRSTNHFDKKSRERVIEIIGQLIRCEELPSAISVYQDKCIATLKSIVKKYLPQEPVVDTPATGDPQVIDHSQLTGSQTSGSKLSQMIREQTVEEFQKMIEAIFTHSCEALRRLYCHQKLLLDISLNELESFSDTNENQHNMITQLDILPTITEIIRIVQLRTGKIIAVRRDINASLSCEAFLKLYYICVLFIQECEALSGEFLTKYLSDVLAFQIKNYLVSKETRDYNELRKLLSHEHWVPYVVAPSSQNDVNAIFASIDIDPLEWTSIANVTPETEDAPDNADENDVSTSPCNEKEGTATVGHRKSVVVGNKTFVASETLLCAIGKLKELMILAVNLPSIYLPLLEKLSFNLLTFFNDTTMDHVNKDGSSERRTNRNLSIVGESIDCMTEFVSVVQSFFQRLSNSTKDFRVYDAAKYQALLEQYQSSSQTIHLGNAPPIPT